MSISRNRLAAELEALVDAGEVSPRAAGEVARLIVNELDDLEKRVAQLERRVRQIRHT